MTPTALKRLRTSLELTTDQWGKVLRCTSRGVRKWESGENPIPGPVIAFCRLLVFSPQRARLIAIKHLLELASK